MEINNPVKATTAKEAKEAYLYEVRYGYINWITELINWNINGAINIKKIIPSALFIFIMPPDMETLKNRLIGRKTESKDKVVQRFITAYNEVNNYKKYNYVVVNDKVEDAVNKVKSIIQSEKCRVDRIEDIYLGNKEELIHEILIDKNFENNY